MPSGSPPFSRFEVMIAWRYLRAKRAEGGVAVMTWISLIGISLAVFALVATLAVRAGLQDETVRTILGANAHIELRYTLQETEAGGTERVIRDYVELTEKLRATAGVVDAVPVVIGRVIANNGEDNAPIELFGITQEDLMRYTSVSQARFASGDLERLSEGIAIGSRLAESLNADVGDKIRVISPNGARTAFGVSPRVSVFEVVYIFRSGQSYIDATRAYLPLTEAQPYLNREGAVDQVEIMVAQPEDIDSYRQAILEAAGTRAYLWSWRQRAGGMLRALELQDNALFILLAILVLIATMNIISGLIMLVKNKGRDIGILRTMGLSQGNVLRVFFMVGAFIGVIGTICGVAMGAVFAANIDYIYAAMDVITGGEKTAIEEQGFFFPPAILRGADLALAVALSLGLSFVVTWFPARRAANMSPVEALRYE